MSSILSIPYFLQVSTIPPDSSWKTPMVSPRLSSSSAGLSSSSIS